MRRRRLRVPPPPAGQQGRGWKICEMLRVRGVEREEEERAGEADVITLGEAGESGDDEARVRCCGGLQVRKHYALVLSLDQRLRTPSSTHAGNGEKREI